MLKQLIAAVMAMAFTVPLYAADTDNALPAAPPTPTSAATRDALDKAISDQRDRRSAAIAGFAVGGAAILAGAVVSDVAVVENQNDENNTGTEGTRNHTTALLVGLGVGLPIIGISAWVFTDAQKQIHTLHRQRVLLSYSQETHQPVVSLAFDF